MRYSTNQLNARNETGLTEISRDIKACVCIIIKDKYMMLDMIFDSCSSQIDAVCNRQLRNLMIISFLL